jgi:ABC-2 type transport system ATP-binding protein
MEGREDGMQNRLNGRGNGERQAVARLSGVTKRYGAVKALDDVDLGLARGQVTALLGPNGAGKTTTVKLLLGLAQPSAGKVAVFGGDPRARAQRCRIGAMLQIAKVPETLRVGEHLKLFASYYPQPLALDEVAEAAGLSGLEHRLYGKLSGGQQKRLQFALAVVGDPDLLFLDEPTTGLDVESRRALWRQIRRLTAAGKTVLLTTHYLEEADALADRVVVIGDGRLLADGSPAEIKAQVAARRVRCTTRLAAEELAALPAVARVERHNETLEIHTSEAEAVVRELLARDPALADLEVTGAGLEEAFLDLTGCGAAGGGAGATQEPAEDSPAIDEKGAAA